MKRRIQKWLGITAWIEAILKDQQVARDERITLDARIFGLEERADKCEVRIASLQGSRTVDDVRILSLEVEVAKLQATQPLPIVRESAQAKPEPLRAKNFREFRESVEDEKEATNV